MLLFLTIHIVRFYSDKEEDQPARKRRREDEIRPATVEPTVPQRSTDGAPFSTSVKSLALDSYYSWTATIERMVAIVGNENKGKTKKTVRKTPQYLEDFVGVCF